MKKFDNKKITVIGKDSSYAELIKLCNEVIPEKGWTSKSMAQAIKIDSIMEEKKAEETIELEDADMDYVKATIEKMPWAIKDKEVVLFCEYFKTIK